MSEHENCPCDAVRELKKIVERHEQQLNTGATSFALIKQDLEHIKGTIEQAVEKKSRFNASVATTAINVVLTILLTWLAVKLGISV